MDGNGRWAQKRGLPRFMGHKKGAEVLRRIVRAVLGHRIPFLTVYAFSSENWKRPPAEVRYILHLFERHLEREARQLIEHDIRLRVIGDRSRFSDRLRTQIEDLEKLSQNHKTLTLQVAFGYGGRDELVRAAKTLARDVKTGTLAVDDIDQACLEDYLYTGGVPDPDLLVRTGGEQRISNYLLWQMAYTEFLFKPTFWPDFTPRMLDSVLTTYKTRDRRFGDADPSRENIAFSPTSLTGATLATP
jgi:undecaprenyl diphosphate synthase